MTANGWAQILFFFTAVLLVTAPLGAYMHRVLEGENHFLRRPLDWLERLVYRLGGVDGHEQPWTVYTGGLLAFSAFTLMVTYLIQRLQHLLPLNPQGLGPVEASSAFNTAASFTTNTNWQGYVGEATMSYLSQMAGLGWHNFISAATGNNGSAFAGLNANTLWYNTALGIAMLVGRFLIIVPALAIAGVLAGKKSVPPSPGTLPTTGPLFATLLVGVIVIVGALTFFPVLSLGPIVEHFLMHSGKVF